MVNICNFIRKTDNLTFQSGRLSNGLVITDSIDDFPGQIQSLSIFLQNFYPTNALFNMLKSIWTNTINCPLSSISKGCVPQIVSKADCLYQLFVQLQCFRNSSGRL